MIDVKELQILNRKDCICGKHEFNLKDLKKLETITDAHGFYGNIIKHYSYAECPICNQAVILLLKQKGQTWEIMNTAVTADMNVSKEITSTGETITELDGERAINPELIKDPTEKDVTDEIETQEQEENNSSQEFICPVCKKVCKNQLGLNSHIKTHKN